MNAYEFLTEKNNGKTPDELVRDGDCFNAGWVIALLEEYAQYYHESRVTNCNKHDFSPENIKLHKN